MQCPTLQAAGRRTNMETGSQLIDRFQQCLFAIASGQLNKISALNLLIHASTYRRQIMSRPQRRHLHWPQFPSARGQRTIDATPHFESYTEVKSLFFLWLSGSQITKRNVTIESATGCDLT